MISKIQNLNEKGYLDFILNLILHKKGLFAILFCYCHYFLFIYFFFWRLHHPNVLIIVNSFLQAKINIEEEWSNNLYHFKQLKI